MSSTRPSLLSLSNELLLLIAEERYRKTFRSRDLSPLRLCCRRLYGVATPVFWRNYCLHCDDVEIHEDLMCLSDHPRCAGLIRDFFIAFERFDRERPETRTHIYLFGHLLTSSLSTVTTLEFIFDESNSPGEPPQVPILISNALSQLRQLRSLTLWSCRFDQGFNLREAIPSLRKLVLHHWTDPYTLVTNPKNMAYRARSSEDRPVASLTELELLGDGVRDGAMILALLAPCIDSLRVVKLQGAGERRGIVYGETPSFRLPYSLYRGVSDIITSMARRHSVKLPLERLEVSVWQVFQPATADEVQHGGRDRTLLASSKRYALGDLLDLFTQHAPKLRHLKLEDYGNMATPIAIETWPSAHSVTELELVATIPRGEPGENPKSLITESRTIALRALLSRFPSLTHLYLTGFLECFTPRQLSGPDDILFSIRYPRLAVFLAMVEHDFPSVERIEFRWRNLDWEPQALFCIKDAGRFVREFYSNC